MDRHFGSFVWNIQKEWTNVRKHGVDFVEASEAFLDPHRKIFTDSKHHASEQRFFCIARVGDKILTVRFVYRTGKIRIFGAGYWRKGRSYYEKKND